MSKPAIGKSKFFNVVHFYYKKKLWLPTAGIEIFIQDNVKHVFVLGNFSISKEKTLKSYKFSQKYFRIFFINTALKSRYGRLFKCYLLFFIVEAMRKIIMTNHNFLTFLSAFFFFYCWIKAIKLLLDFFFFALCLLNYYLNVPFFLLSIILFVLTEL